MSTVANVDADDAKKTQLINDAMRGKWDGVVRTYKESRFVQDVEITRMGDTVLHLAVSHGNIAIVKQLVEAVDHGDAPMIFGHKNSRGSTPLHVAAALGKKDVCSVIAARQRELILEAQNNEGETPLFVAALHGRTAAFLELHRLSRKVSPGHSDLFYWKRTDGDTILHCAISGEHFGLAFQIMQLYGALINVKNKKGETALHLLANKPHAFESGSHLELFDRIIYACIVIRPLGVIAKEECDIDDSTQIKFEVDKFKFLRDLITEISTMSKHIFTKMASARSRNKKENKQGNSTKSCNIQTPHDSSNQFQSSRAMANDQDSNDFLEGIIIEGKDVEQEQIKFQSDLHEQHQDYGTRDEDLDSSLNEIVIEGSPRERPQLRILVASPESFKAVVEDEEHGDLSTRAQILGSVAAWSIFFIYGLKILLIIIGIVGIGIWRMRIIHQRKQKHKYAFQIMEKLVDSSALWEPANVREPHAQHGQKIDTPILIAAKKGVKEIVKKILDTFPIAMQDLDSDGKNVVLLAVENRQPDVYRLMLKRETVRESVFGIVDSEGNSALHLAATLGKSQRPWAVPGAALQMQLEIKWYKFIERSMAYDIFVSFNKQEQRAKDIFYDHHKELITEGRKWLTSTSKSCSVVAALIATVAFASISIVPGGTDQKNGNPLQENNVAFEIFAISSLVALCSSVTSLVMFLSILTSRYEEGDFEKRLPSKLILGLTFVFLGIGAMLIAFCSAHFFVVQKKLRYVAYPIYAVYCLPITIFAMAHFRLFIDLITSIFTHVPRQRAYKNHSL